MEISNFEEKKALETSKEHPTCYGVGLPACLLLALVEKHDTGVHVWTKGRRLRGGAAYLSYS